MEDPKLLKQSWEKRTELRYHNPWLQAILQSYSHETTRYSHKCRHRGLWNRIKSLEINPCTSGQLIYDKEEVISDQIQSKGSAESSWVWGCVGCYWPCVMSRWHSGEESACQCTRHRRRGLNPWVKKIPWRRNMATDPLQYSCLKIPMDRGVWWATVLRVTKSQVRLSD